MAHNEYANQTRTQYQREWRARNPEKVRESNRHTQTARVAYTREWRKANREKVQAWAAVARHLDSQPCEVCGTTEHIHAHHKDYSEPLEVMWLCAEHHKGVHSYD